MVADPFAGAVEVEKADPSVRPSASVALRSPEAVESSAMDAWLSPDTLVASSTAETERLMVVFDEELRSSVMETAKESDPKETWGWGSKSSFRPLDQ